MLKRTAVMQYTGEIELSTKPLKIWGYGKKGATRNRVGEYVCRHRDQQRWNRRVCWQERPEACGQFVVGGFRRASHRVVRRRHVGSRASAPTRWPCRLPRRTTRCSPSWKAESMGTRFIEELLTLVDTAPDSTTYLTAEQGPDLFKRRRTGWLLLNPRIRRATGGSHRATRCGEPVGHCQTGSAAAHATSPSVAHRAVAVRVGTAV